MNIALVGHGKMGKAVENYIIEHTNDEVVLVINSQTSEQLNPTQLSTADVVIEFSHPDSAANNIETCLLAGIPVVSGTTGWTSQLGNMIATASKQGVAFFYASNFSLGVALFQHAARELARLSNLSDYKVRLDESHHIEKVDQPSGTAITTVNELLPLLSNYDNWALNEDKERAVGVHCQRVGSVKGDHCVTFDSDVDTIKISHSAKSRVGFAMGAHKAAQFVIGKQGFYSMNDLLGLENK